MTPEPPDPLQLATAVGKVVVAMRAWVPPPGWRRVNTFLLVGGQGQGEFAGDVYTFRVQVMPQAGGRPRHVDCHVTAPALARMREPAALVDRVITGKIVRFFGDGQPAPLDDVPSGDDSPDPPDIR